MSEPTKSSGFAREGLANRRSSETLSFCFIRRALLRGPQGVAASPLGIALDLCSHQ
jgi:hypothetical protein